MECLRTSVKPLLDALTFNNPSGLHRRCKPPPLTQGRLNGVPSHKCQAVARFSYFQQPLRLAPLVQATSPYTGEAETKKGEVTLAIVNPTYP